MSTSLTVDTLVSAPRGRRLLLELALLMEVEPMDGATDDELHGTLAHAVFVESFHREERGGSVVFGPGAREVRRTRFPPAEVGRRLDAVGAGDPSTAMLIDALTATVDSARYWQPPDGADRLAAEPALRGPLRRLAERVLRLGAARDWDRPLQREDQWVVTWHDRPAGTDRGAVSVLELLHRWSRDVRAGEERASRRRPTSGEWWSTPPEQCPGSTSSLPDGSPAGLRLIEDSFGGDRAVVRRLAVPLEARVIELTGPEDWTELCRRFPLEVTAQKGADWSATTGRTGRWVQPDWSRVAGEAEGVHLTVAGYLTTATRALDLGDGRAGLLAGWDPDRTIWLTDDVRSGTG